GLSTLSGTVAAQGGTLVTQGNAITVVQASLSDKADLEAVEMLQVSISDNSGNCVHKSTFNDESVGMWGASGYTPSTGLGAVEYEILFSQDITEQGNDFPVKEGDVFDVSARVFAGSGSTVAFGVGVKNSAGSTFSIKTP